MKPVNRLNRITVIECECGAKFQRQFQQKHNITQRHLRHLANDARNQKIHEPLRQNKPYMLYFDF